MVFHIILFRPRADLDAGQTSVFLESIRTAARSIPSIRAFWIGQRVTHGRGYEQAMVDDYPYSAVIEFDSLDGLKRYLDHPAHANLGARFGEASEAALIYDYQMEQM